MCNQMAGSFFFFVFLHFLSVMYLLFYKGLYVQQVVKKPKMIKQLQNKSVDTLHLAGGSVPSPVASQMSNMCDPNKFIKMLGGAERGRKSKTVKVVWRKNRADLVSGTSPYSCHSIFFT